MLKEKRIFQVRFEGPERFGKKDGIAAILCFIYEVIIIFLFGLLMFHTSIYTDFTIHFRNKFFYRLIFYIPMALVQVLPVFIYMKLNHQSIRSIGLKTDKILKSVLLGILFSLPFILPNLVNEIRYQRPITDLLSCFWQFLYFFLEIALIEELVFRGFIQTRIQGLIKNKCLGILAAGLMFSLTHIPFQMIKANLSLTEFVVQNSIHLILLIFDHVYFTYIYTRNNNIASSTVAHALMDFIPSVLM